MLFAPENRITGQPLIPLRAGQAGLVVVSGLAGSTPHKSIAPGELCARLARRKDQV
jgi:hypothetical protein